jgi:hypothetical protein
MKILVACEESQAVTKAFRAMGHDAYSCDILPTRGEHPEWHYQQDVTSLLEENWDMILAFPDCTFLTISAEWAYKDTSEIKNKKLSPDKLYGEARKQAREQAAEFFMLFANNKCERVAIENPIGIMSTKYRKPNQIIQPWMFGHNASKQTCLWLKGLPKLKHGKIIAPIGYQRIKYASEMPLCPDCEEEVFCHEHEMHFGDCSCFGPTQDDVFYRRINGYEFGTQTEGLRPVWGNQTLGGYNKLGPSPTRARDRSVTYQGIADAMAEQWGR